MTTKEQVKPRYRAPTVSVDADVSLDEFDIDDIKEYLRHNGHYASTGPADDPIAVNGLFIDQDDLNRIETLALCGQTDAARANALEIISEAIGRKL